jgi:hypothetical protein
MTEAARALVTGQMIADIVIVGLRGQDHRRRREARAAAATDFKRAVRRRRAVVGTTVAKILAVTVAVGAGTGRVLTV